MQPIEKLLAFDIETSEQAQDNKISPITVASTVTSDGEERAWFSHPTDPSIHGMIGKGSGETWANFSPDGQLAPLMSRETAQKMLAYMDEKQKQGYSICAWNGAGFDLKMIGHLAEDIDLAGRITMNLIDPMYQVLTIKGYPVGLAAAQKGLGVPQAKSMSGKDAPDAWQKGQFQKVIGYVIGDSQITIQVVNAIAKTNGIAWIAKTGKPSSVIFDKIKTIAECLLDPEPNNSWMEKPIDRQKIIEWIPEAIRKGSAKKEKKDNSPKPNELAGLKPVLLILSGPSGVGKSLLCSELIRTIPSINRIVTTTTRPPRRGETNSCYKFVSNDQFEKLVAAGEFLEWAEVHGYKYGSPKAEISKRLAKKEDVAIIVDVQGAKNIREFFSKLPENVRQKFRVADVFIAPPSMDELEKRLTDRQDQAIIDLRMSNAKKEMEQSSLYKYTIVNDDIHKAWDRLRSIVIAERSLS